VSDLADAADEYLRLRRSLGYKLVRSGQPLGEFVAHLERIGLDHITIDAAVDWATIPAKVRLDWTSAPRGWQPGDAPLNCRRSGACSPTPGPAIFRPPPDVHGDPGVGAGGHRHRRCRRGRLPDSCHPGKGRQGLGRALPRVVQGDPCPLYRGPEGEGRRLLFESSWKKAYTDRGVRKILARYTQAAGITASVSPHRFPHFLFA